jgi:hypothetical protein
MSMNLCFDVVGGGHVEFPYQTRTELTYEVLKAKTADERLELIAEDLERIGDESFYDMSETLEEVSMLLKNPNLILSFI